MTYSTIGLIFLSGFMFVALQSMREVNQDHSQLKYLNYVNPKVKDICE